MEPLFLTDDEVREICAPLISSSAQIRFLRTLGLVVNVKPNGRPLVVRSHAEAVLSGRAEAAAAENAAQRAVPWQPDIEAYKLKFGKKRAETRKLGSSSADAAGASQEERKARNPRDG